jgi:hypothetical protein
MKSRLNRTLFASLLLAITVGALPAQSLEVLPLYTSQSYFALDGCCQSAAMRGGSAAIVRVNFEKIGTWDLFGMSDMKWNEASLLRPIYLIGDRVVYDPSIDSSTQVRRVPRSTLVLSYGGGFFTHNTRTKQFSLASLVTGISLISHLEYQYAISDQFSLVAVGRVGVGLSLDDRGAIFSPMLGLLWRL